jgi:hypothetical protein
MDEYTKAARRFCHGFASGTVIACRRVGFGRDEFDMLLAMMRLEWEREDIENILHSGETAGIEEKEKHR